MGYNIPPDIEAEMDRREAYEAAYEEFEEELINQIQKDDLTKDEFIDWCLDSDIVLKYAEEMWLKRIQS